MSAAVVIEVEGLSKCYGSRYAVRELSFQVKAREVVGFLGPNGAGKTTTLRMIAGFLGATAGYVRVGDVDVAEQSLAARRKLGYMPEQCPLYTEMRVAEYLKYRAALKGVARGKRLSKVDRALQLAQLTDRRDTLIGHLSKGYRQRVGLADALVAEPELLILDEPTSGLDPNQIRDVRQVIATLKQEHTILLSTHILREVEATCDRALVIHQGRLVADSVIEELRSQSQPRAIEVIVRSPGPLLTGPAALAVTSREPIPLERERWVIELGSKAAHNAGLRSVDAWVQHLVTLGAGVLSVSPVGSSLEDAFAALTQAQTEDTALVTEVET